MKYFTCFVVIICVSTTVLFSQGEFVPRKSHAVGAGYGYEYSEDAAINSIYVSFSLAGYLDVGIISGKGLLKNRQYFYHRRDENFSTFGAGAALHIKKPGLNEHYFGWSLSMSFLQSDFTYPEAFYPGDGRIEYHQREENYRTLLLGTSFYITRQYGNIVFIPSLSANYSFANEGEGGFILGLSGSVGYKIYEKLILNIDLSGVIETQSSKSVLGSSIGLIWIVK